jgi:putative transcriptional regulator
MASDLEGSLKGQFLMAMPGLNDPNFFQTVTCLSEHTEAGAFGLVVNRIQAALTAKMIFDELKIVCGPEADQIPIFIGGPVHSGEVFVLHGPPFGWDGCLQVTPTLALSNTRDVIEAIAASRGPDAFIITLGCAGWGRGQLENEIRQNAWITCPIREEIIFKTPVEDRWEASLKHMGIDPSLLSGTAGHA